MNRAGMAAFSSHGSPTANAAMMAVWTRWVVVSPVRMPAGSLVPVPPFLDRLIGTNP